VLGGRRPRRRPCRPSQAGCAEAVAPERRSVFSPSKGPPVVEPMNSSGSRSADSPRRRLAGVTTPTFSRSARPRGRRRRPPESRPSITAAGNVTKLSADRGARPAAPMSPWPGRARARWHEVPSLGHAHAEASEPSVPSASSSPTPAAGHPCRCPTERRTPHVVGRPSPDHKMCLPRGPAVHGWQSSG